MFEVIDKCKNCIPKAIAPKKPPTKFDRSNQRSLDDSSGANDMARWCQWSSTKSVVFESLYFATGSKLYGVAMFNSHSHRHVADRYIYKIDAIPCDMGFLNRGVDQSVTYVLEGAEMALRQSAKQTRQTSHFDAPKTK